MLPLHRKVRVGFPIQRKPLMYSGLLTSETESTRTLEPLRTEFSLSQQAPCGRRKRVRPFEFQSARARPRPQQRHNCPYSSHLLHQLN